MSEETVIKNKEQNAARTFGMPWNQVTRTNHEGTLKRVLNWWPGNLFKSPKERGETTQKEKAPNSNSSKGSSGGGGDSGPVNIDIGGQIQTYGGK